MQPMERPARLSVPPTSSRPVRTERWQPRAFFAFPCAFLLDVPLDMTGVIHGALRAANASGVRPLAGRDVYATDAPWRGAILVEVEDDARGDSTLTRIAEGEMLVRDLPEKPVRLRAELDELLRWSRELGFDVGGTYVRYEIAPGSARPIAVFAALRGESGV